MNAVRVKASGPQWLMTLAILGSLFLGCSWLLAKSTIGRPKVVRMDPSTSRLRFPKPPVALPTVTPVAAVSWKSQIGQQEPPKTTANVLPKSMVQKSFELPQHGQPSPRGFAPAGRTPSPVKSTILPGPVGFLPAPKSLPSAPGPDKLEPAWIFELSNGDVVRAKTLTSFTLELTTEYGPVSIGKEQFKSLKVLSRIEADQVVKSKNVEDDAESIEAGAESESDQPDADEPEAENSAADDTDEPKNVPEMPIRYNVVVATNSGDVISGSCVLADFDVSLEWGKAIIDAENIRWMSFGINQVFKIDHRQNGFWSLRSMSVQMENSLTAKLKYNSQPSMPTDAQRFSPTRSQLPIGDFAQ